MMKFKKLSLSSYRNTETAKSQSSHQSSPLLTKGFTIVELLIVVVVIAILAAIAIVVYNGITRSAEESAIKTDLSQTTMQTFTPSNCSSLTTYTGSNEGAIITLTDNRGGTERTYQVAKLADGNCWMLDNLKLGSTTGEITLTPSDTDIDENFTLPQLQGAGTATDPDNPIAYGPVPGDTGSGETNYGYLYSWPAATAGEGREDMPAGSGNAPHSICPANWRLPTGSSTGEFAMLNAKMNNPDASAPATNGGTGFYQNWHNTGPFKGVFSGDYYGTTLSYGKTFSLQGSNGYFWSSSAHPAFDGRALFAGFSASGVDPDNSLNRNFGFAVRCLFN